MVTTAELVAYAESEIKRLGLGDSPTNCHGIVAQGRGVCVRLTDGVGLDVFCDSRFAVDVELAKMVEWYAESK